MNTGLEPICDDNCSLPGTEVLLLAAPPPPPKEPVGLLETLAVLSGGAM
jgi:hypothetical protein